MIKEFSERVYVCSQGCNLVFSQLDNEIEKVQEMIYDLKCTAKVFAGSRVMKIAIYYKRAYFRL